MSGDILTASGISTRSHIQNGVWIQEVYEGGIESRRQGGMTLTRKYILRKKGDSHRNPTQEMHQFEASRALHQYILVHQYNIDYETGAGVVRMWPASISVDVDKGNYPVYKGEAKWIYDPRTPNYITQPTTWSHRMTGGTRKVAFPMYPQRHYPRPGFPVVPHVGVNWDSSRQVYEGVDAYSPEWTMVAKQQLLTSLVTSDYMRMLYAVAKTTNGAPFMGFAPGEILYLGPETDQTINSISDFDYEVTNLSHQFIVEPNLGSFMFDGAIPVTHKLGHEYLWVSVNNMSNNGPAQPVATQVNVAPIYATSSFDLLGLGF